MSEFVGLTWDHPRGRDALVAASGTLPGGDAIHWETQPLEGFESAAIDDLAARYDLVVMDHPHLGDAIATGSVTPLDEVFDPAEIAAWRAGAVGPSVASYTADGSVWALPLDAATQVSARRTRAVPEPIATWDEALAAPCSIALSLAGPHAFLTFCSIAVSLGTEPFAEGRIDREVGHRALEIMRQLAERRPRGCESLNPISLLERMRDAGDIDYIPLVFGYANYSSDDLQFGAPPAGARVGSTIGGTGIAITRRTRVTLALIEHLRWLLSPEAQSEFVPQNAGQPGLRSAWTHPGVDAAAHGFYSATLSTIDAAWIRPRFAGYVPIQDAASACVREAVLGSEPTEKALDEIEQLFAPVRKDTP